MNIAAIRTWWGTATGWEKTALAVWSIILLVVCVRVWFQPESKTVYPIFSYSGRFWWSGIDLYEPHRPRSIKITALYLSSDPKVGDLTLRREEFVQGGFRYLPAFAILVSPFALIPDAVGGIVWRLGSTAVLFGSLVWLARAVLPRAPSRDGFAWLLLLCIPLSLQSVNNGQANIIVIAAMLASIAAVKEERWNLASALTALTFVCKVYPLALGMLLMVLYPRRLGWRMPLGVAAGLAAPFLFQNPGYVLRQYDQWFELLRNDDRSYLELDAMYRDLWLLIRVFDLDHFLTRPVYMMLEAATGAGIAVIAWHRQRTGWSEKALLTSTLALASAWMMVLGPATESSSFILLAPSFAWSVLDAWRSGAVARPRHWLLWGSFWLFAAAVLLGGFTSTVKIHALGVHPWASLLYVAYLLTEPAPSVESAATPVTLRAAA